MVKRYNGSNIKNIDVLRNDSALSVFANLKNKKTVMLFEVEKQSKDEYKLKTVLPVTKNVIKKVKAFEKLLFESYKEELFTENALNNLEIKDIECTKHKDYLCEIIEVLNTYIYSYDEIYFPDEEIVDVEILRKHSTGIGINVVLKNGEKKNVAWFNYKNARTLMLTSQDIVRIAEILYNKKLDDVEAKIAKQSLEALVSNKIDLIEEGPECYSAIDNLVVNKDAIIRYFKKTKQKIK